ncbi:MAG: DUF5694 domain-containing protein [Acidobacteriia bacterium]|nr:DUF5694 domain-containing protein [Terriglobia bacterium]
MKKIFLSVGVLAISIASWAQRDARPEVLVLGAFHMSNPGHDIHNMQADDVLAPRRQQEIVQLIEVLKRFHPTKIAIEADIGSQRVGQEYSDYLAGKYTLSRNETNQIGYRLAKELGHHALYPIDVDGEFPWQRVVNYAKANGRAEKLNAINASWGTLVKEQGDFLQSHTVLETLEYMNSDSRAAEDMALYYATVHFGDPFDYAGPDLLAAWYQRNVRIYNNIVKLIESPNERILVIYGAGHLGWLRQDVANDPTVKLRELADLTGQH